MYFTFLIFLPICETTFSTSTPIIIIFWSLLFWLIMFVGFSIILFSIFFSIVCTISIIIYILDFYWKRIKIKTKTKKNLKELLSCLGCLVGGIILILLILFVFFLLCLIPSPAPTTIIIFILLGIFLVLLKKNEEGRR
ncbi:MAG: hypothetical protein ACP6IY_19500 [Promethearchaeia archaeon]